MTETNNPLAPYQVDCLLLLVGGNPLPNAVTAASLAKKEGRIALIHTQESFPIAQRLAAWLVNNRFRPPILKQVKENEANTIYTAVAEITKQSAGESVGLNYTGGTKAMAAHAYRALSQWGKAQGVAPVFTYLDARSLSMVIDAAAPESGGFARTMPMSLWSGVTLADLFHLHGWTLLSNSHTNEPFLPQTSAALHRVHHDQDQRAAWDKWKRTVLQQQCRRSDRPDKWLSQTKLKGICLPWPDDPVLGDLVAALRQELGLTGDCLALEAAAAACGLKKIEDFCQWLNGGYWLETVTLQALQALAAASNLREIYMNLNPRVTDGETDFELDVAALRGYQLFAFSCSVDNASGRLKLKLFEAYARARQLGGDEARVGLVCFSDDPKKLEAELSRRLSAAGQIKIFGRNDLTQLERAIAAWLSQ